VKRLIASALVLLLVAGPVRADDKDNDGNNLGDPRAALAKILDLMKEVESRLNDAAPDEQTQADQKKVVEAMKFEDKTKAALDDLIKKLEHMEGS